MHKRFFRFWVCTLIMCLVVPLPLAGSAATQNPAKAHVQARLNSPERAAAIAKALEMDKAAKEAFVQSGVVSHAAAPTPQLGLQGSEALAGVSKGQRPLAAGGSPTRPKSASEVLFNAATAVMGMPGLTHNGYDPYAPDSD